jgi:hypothetical protein
MDHPTAVRARPRARIALAVLLALLGMNALAGGWYGMTGARGVPTEWLGGSPFRSYFVPSLILFVIVGGVALFAAVAVVRQLRRARVAALAAGTIAVVWIAVQLAIIGYVSWLQPLVAGGGLLILRLAATLER